MNTQKPIDFVIIWVDGADPAWRAEKDRWLETVTGKPSGIDAGENRFRDWDNLRYWFRAVERYAPWVNRIHFVTCGQVPDWLNTAAPKLHLVNHRDYIPPQYLPTFSSHPIELNLHRIPGLAEQFVYFNDDFFLTAPVTPEDFFVDGLPCDCIAEDPIQFPDVQLYNSIRINDVVFMNRHFDRMESMKRLKKKWFSPLCPQETLKNLLLAQIRKPCFFGLNCHHLPQAYLKSTLENAWAAEPEWFGLTCSHRFRDERDISMHAMKFYQLLTGQFHPYSKHRFGKALRAQADLEQICQIIRSRRFQAVCINDADVTDFTGCRDRLLQAFQEALPQKSTFEK